MTDKRRAGTLGRLARILDAASKDAERARKSASDPAFRQQILRDRRGALSQYQTVKDALEDRAQIERAKKAKAAARARARAKPTSKKRATRK